MTLLQKLTAETPRAQRSPDKLTLRRYLPWRGLNPTVRRIRFHPVGLFGPLTPCPLSPGLAAGERGQGDERDENPSCALTGKAHGQGQTACAGSSTN
jgi:hypothetical protein